jgi:hypothetical protein
MVDLCRAALVYLVGFMTPLRFWEHPVVKNARVSITIKVKIVIGFFIEPLWYKY